MPQIHTTSPIQPLVCSIGPPVHQLAQYLKNLQPHVKKDLTDSLRAQISNHEDVIYLFIQVPTMEARTIITRKYKPAEHIHQAGPTYTWPAT